MSEMKEEKTGSGFLSFMEGKKGNIVIGASAAAAAVCVIFAGASSYGIVEEESEKPSIVLEEEASYNTKDDVAAYVYKYGHLPDNYITKGEAQASGWVGGDVSVVVPGKEIGGDRFYDIYYIGDGPVSDEGRYYIECDVNTENYDDRGTERIVFSNDGLVYYTPDHYKTFELLYGEEVLKEFYN